MNDLVLVKLKEMVNLHNIIKNNYLNYKSRHAKTCNFGEYSLPIVF